MTLRRRLATLSALAALFLPGPGEIPDTDTGFRVRTASGWRPASPAALASVLHWETMQGGIELGEFTISAPGEAIRTRVIVLRLQPARHRLHLETLLRSDLVGGAWTVDRAGPATIAAFNAGQFTGIASWGWTVVEGREVSPPRAGPLSLAVAQDSSGQVRLLPSDSIAAHRARAGIRTAFQSYPVLLQPGARIPEPLEAEGLGVAVHHRDARLALGNLADGRLLVLLTRFDALGPTGGAIPFGLTLAETATLLRNLGATQAVALDGGISAQLMVRTRSGGRRVWRGWRKVPYGLEIRTVPGAPGTR